MSLAEEQPVWDFEGPPVSRDRLRSRRHRSVRARTLSEVRASRRELAAGREEFPPDEDLGVERPRTRADCIEGVRPCPFVSCKFNLYLDVAPSGSLKLNFPDLEPDEMDPRRSCALDIAARDGATLEEVGQATNLTRERVRQVEVRALARLQPQAKAKELGEAAGLVVGPDGKRRLPLAPDESRVRLREFTAADVDDLAADDDE